MEIPAAFNKRRSVLAQVTARSEYPMGQARLCLRQVV